MSNQPPEDKERSTNQPSEEAIKLMLALFKRTSLPRILKEIESGELQLSDCIRTKEQKKEE